MVAMKYDNMISCPTCERNLPDGEGTYFKHISRATGNEIFECFHCGTLMIVPSEEWK